VRTTTSVATCDWNGVRDSSGLTPVGRFTADQQRHGYTEKAGKGSPPLEDLSELLIFRMQVARAADNVGCEPPQPNPPLFAGRSTQWRTPSPHCLPGQLVGPLNPAGGSRSRRLLD
jgi:hypothetical protein